MKLAKNQISVGTPAHSHSTPAFPSTTAPIVKLKSDIVAAPAGTHLQLKKQPWSHSFLSVQLHAAVASLKLFIHFKRHLGDIQ